ncbi:hypothetical protein ACJIZ3_018251 [Penstemon smallii]|uniref:Uncharacterized protein n=1 Tax=Penstemon smallii TaxID=265156 RepID=A0ABD3SXV0_9LAMI
MGCAFSRFKPQEVKNILPPPPPLPLALALTKHKSTHLILQPPSIINSLNPKNNGRCHCLLITRKRKKIKADRDNLKHDDPINVIHKPQTAASNQHIQELSAQGYFVASTNKLDANVVGGKHVNRERKSKLSIDIPAELEETEIGRKITDAGSFLIGSPSFREYLESPIITNGNKEIISEEKENNMQEEDNIMTISNEGSKKSGKKRRGRRLKKVFPIIHKPAAAVRKLLKVQSHIGDTPPIAAQ